VCGKTIQSLPFLQILNLRETNEIVNNKFRFLFTEKTVVSFMIRKRVACGRKEKQENKIGENLSQEKRKKEKMHARRKN
jgi:hypothetical protein